MRLKGKRRRFSILAKLVLAFLAVISPLYLLGAFMNVRGAKIVEKEITVSLQQQVGFYLMSLESEIERMTVLQREFMNDEDLQNLSALVEGMSIYERLAAMKKVQNRLSLIQKSSPYIAEARAYLPSVSRTVSSGISIDDLDGATLERLKEDIRNVNTVSPFLYKDGAVYIREYYPSPYNLDKRDPKFVLELEVSLPALHKFLQELPGYETGGAVLLHEGAVIVSDQHAASYSRLAGKLQALLAGPGETYGAEAVASGGGPAVRTGRVAIGKESYMTVALTSRKLGPHLLVYVPESEVMGPIQRYRTFMWAISVIAVMVIVVFAYWIYRIIHRPLRKLVGAFRKVESGIMQAEIRHNSNDEFHYLYEKFNYMVAHLNKLIYEVYEQKIHLQQSELKQLQSQINPHFLYNSFYLLYRMIKAYDIDTATRFTMFLGDYYQYLTRNGREEVRLEEEIRHVRAYTEIQSIRFGDRVRVELEELPEGHAGMAVPRLILQPIVENAYQHAFDSDLERCLLHIGFAVGDAPSGGRQLAIRVQDNGAGLSDEQLEEWRFRFSLGGSAGEVTGMLNVQKRLRLKYGDAAGIRLERGDPGLIVTLTIPVALPEREESAGGDTDEGKGSG